MAAREEADTDNRIWRRHLQRVLGEVRGRLSAQIPSSFSSNFLQGRLFESFARCSFTSCLPAPALPPEAQLWRLPRRF